MIEHRHTWVYSPDKVWRTCEYCGEQQQFDGVNYQIVGKVEITAG